ncbi:hypothetical protein [Halomonas organivorans]|uniref:Uncharacterized protein n=1 Tax=Halomonas organivorans TaxID=257772 RepID=A0A7W5BUB3_9GAMM|nr:hypothetical protein [Halomonas organivorans]MBB3139259.1 hypothetical protein [Halomonas organivorans]
MNRNHCEPPSFETINCILVTRLKSAEQLIKKDIDNGVISVEDTASFESLHQATDPNCYICVDSEPATSMEKEHLSSYGVEDWIEYWQTLIEIVDAWLRAGMNDNILNHLDDEILIKRF